MYSKEEIAQFVQQTKTFLAAPIAADDLSLLKKTIVFHDWCYYVNSNPLITDSDYDFLFTALKKIENENPLLITADSPTQRVAFGTINNFESAAHLVPMLSLENSYNEGDIQDFVRKVKESTFDNAIEICIEPKFDGASIALVYENDLLVRASTRGDGAVGEEITHIAKALKSIPLSAPFSKMGIAKIEIRGEVIIQNEVFKRINEKRKTEGQKTFLNTRNTAAGSLRLKDASEASKRGLEAVLYHISFAENSNHENLLGTTLYSHISNIQLLNSLGFKTPIHEIGCFTTADAIMQFLATWKEKRYTFPIETDGMVLKVNDLKKQQQCGSTTHHPKWAIAFKFPAKQANSKLLTVEYQVGRTGAITPVAKIEPVELSGVTISSISLHNEDFIKEKNILLGDTLIVERAGEVIPYIIGSIAELRNGSAQPIAFPKECPSCSSLLFKTEEEAVWRCENAECPAQAEERVIHYVSKDAMDIEGLGRSIVIDFIQQNILTNIEDIYKLPFEKIKTMEGWGEKSIQNLQQSIEASKTRSLWRLLVALGIRLVGVSTAKDLTKHIQSVFDLEKMNKEQLTNIEGIGPKVADNIVAFFANEANIHLLQMLKNFGINTEMREEDTQLKSAALLGKTFLFTGSLQQFTRDRAKQLVEENGGALVSGVSSKLNYLVVGADAGSKLSKAKAIPSIIILTEDEFLAMIN